LTAPCPPQPVPPSIQCLILRPAHLLVTFLSVRNCDFSIRERHVKAKLGQTLKNYFSAA
jgi:hypothetical protein